MYGQSATQEGIFEDAALPLVHDILNGYNGTIFAYGQTSSGKTYTMEGNDIADVESRGIIPRVCEALFRGVEDADESIEFQFMVSYVEIYMEKIRDLLDDNRVRVNLAVREDKQNGVYIAGCHEEFVTSVDDMLKVMVTGSQNRATAATGMNEGSSRSHSVFTIKVNQRNVSDGTKTEGKLVLVDLAGSEMVRKTNASGQQLEEAKTINKSLSALGQVINALTDEKSSHIPYRDSKLTRILQDSLGGNSKTVLIIACSPSQFNAPETQSTLRFGFRAKQIKNVVSVNQTRSVEELESLLLRAEKAIDLQQTHIMTLVGQVESLGGTCGDSAGLVPKAGATVDAAVVTELQERIKTLTDELEDEKEDCKRKGAEVDGLSEVIREKERLLVEAGELMLEAQKHYEAQKARAETVSQEKIDITSNLESIRGQLQDELSRTQFEMQELEVTIETSKQENMRLVQELSEMGGGGGAPAINSDNPTSRHASIFVKGGSSSALADAAALASEQASRVDELEQVLAGINLDGASKSEIMSWASRTVLSAGNGNGNGTSTGAGAGDMKDRAKADKRIMEVEAQRAKLVEDLQAMTGKACALQIQLDGGSTDGANGPGGHGVQMRCLQQRLEQLVAVHRQLLRRFAKLELENSDMRKKILLRDERMKQLEGNSRGLSSTLRQTAEKHAQELVGLRQQLLDLRAEQVQRLESRETERPVLKAGSGPKVMRGGGGHGGHGGGPGNTMRGGGSSPDVGDARRTSGSKPSFLARMLGQN